MENKEPNLNKLKSAIKCSEDFENHWNRHALDLDPKSYGWGWDVGGVAYAVASAYCSSAMYVSAYEGVEETNDWFLFLKAKMPKIKEAFEDTAKHLGVDINEMFVQYNRLLAQHISERQRQYPYAQSSINKIDKTHRSLVELPIPTQITHE